MKLITLTNGMVAKVDDEDYEHLALSSWSVVQRTFRSRVSQYARRQRKGETVYMHREILQCPVGFVVDHINGDTLDNRRANLRICTKQMNLMNRAPNAGRMGVKGVQKRGAHKWAAVINVSGQRHWLGIFASQAEAGRAYDAAAKKYHGEFARLNFPEAA